MKPIPPELLVPYYRHTNVQADHTGAAQVAAARRAEALYAVHDRGYSYGDIAAAVGLSRAMVQKLVERARRVR